jgi:lipopolysaccharide export system permease protein
MKKLDWYFAKKFIVAVMFMLVIAAVVAVIFDVSEKVEDFLKPGVTMKMILFDYYLNFIPNIINLISPLIIFISALYFTSRLANNSEIIAVLASGTSYYRLLVPYVAVAVLLACVDIGMKNFIIPRSYTSQLSFELKYVDDYSFNEKNIHRQLDQNTYFYAKAIDYATGRADNFALDKFDGQQLTYKLIGSDAAYDSLSNTWLVRNYRLRTIDGLHEKLTFGDSMRMKLNISMKDFGQKIKSIASMTTPELNRFIVDQKMKGEGLINFYLIEKYKRISMPVDIIVLVLIAVSLGTRKIRGGLGAHLLLGILIAISHELFMRFTTTFATNANFPPILAVWVPTLVYGVLAFYLLRISPK